jgi:hypothetical protein
MAMSIGPWEKLRDPATMADQKRLCVCRDKLAQARVWQVTVLRAKTRDSYHHMGISMYCMYKPRLVTEHMLTVSLLLCRMLPALHIGT